MTLIVDILKGTMDPSHEDIVDRLDIQRDELHLPADASVLDIGVTPKLVGDLISALFDHTPPDSRGKVMRRILTIPTYGETMPQIMDALKASEKPQPVQLLGMFGGHTVGQLMTLLVGIRDAVADGGILTTLAEQLDTPDSIAPTADMGNALAQARVIRAWTKNILLAPLPESAS